MNPDTVLAVLPDNKEEAKSLKEIAFAMGLDISSYTTLARTKTPALQDSGQWK